MDTLKLKKAWEVALAPIKSLPMTFFMMYMSGNSLQIFSIMMVYMAFKNPIMGLVGTNQAFERFESDSNKAKILQVKLAYIAMQLIALGVGIWKVNGMGLLPYDLLPLSAHLLRLDHANNTQDDKIGLACVGGSKGSIRTRCIGVLTNPLFFLVFFCFASL
jgi:hypothetical protein